MTDAQKVELIDKIICEMYECGVCDDLSVDFYRALMICIEVVVNYGGGVK